ncbi:glucosylceramidase [Paenibacillus phyllosphaerae]|uniref:Glucosylceramidase n=1 Tax=Paenibacillus phyllosphaerae TaxID=274593 RepID=A0A7W5AUH9_9BACL|nr:glycoside hydrolase family 30 beta sandwich domain-containing protein [Paenibacillus phyllosphaerae]MBB3108922.1 glucosylceramidase [Paenibacillus phyllosphaerae]
MTETAASTKIAGDQVEVWWSSEQSPGDAGWFAGPMPNRYALEARPAIPLTKPAASSLATTILVTPAHHMQELLGIGTSLEETTIHNLARMSPDVRQRIIRELTNPEHGIGLNLMRITVGTSDFTAQPFYTYNDLPEGDTDFELARFTIQRDIDLGIVDTVKEVLAAAPDVRIFASPWSPPAWMKTNHSLKRGRLKEGDEYTQALARYYRMAIGAYAEQGIPIYAMTLQNEPLLETDYPSCHMPPERQKELAIALKAELAANGLATKLWIFDHNFEDAFAYVAPILNDAAGYAAVDGIALHDYDGSPSVMSELAAAYPDKPIYLTERSVWGTAGAARIAEYFRNYASSYNAWVTMLDSRIGTHQWLGTPGPTMFIQDADQPDRYWRTPEYDLLGQFARFLRPGAKRIMSTGGEQPSVTNVVFANPEGNLVATVINQTDEEQSFRLLCEGWQFTAALPAKTVGTYRWR